MSSNQIGKELTEIMKQYSDEVTDEIGEIIEDVGNKAKDMVKSGSPRRTGKYAKSWNVSFTKQNGQQGFVVSARSPHYRLTHLLENGHKTRNGGRTRPQPHIGTVQDWADGEAMKRIEKAVKG